MGIFWVSGAPEVEASKCLGIGRTCYFFFMLMTDSWSTVKLESVGILL